MEVTTTMEQDRPRGVPPQDLDDETLQRELEHLWETRKDTFFNGSADALAEHTDRMLELERAYAERFPAAVDPAPGRTREGARERDQVSASS